MDQERELVQMRDVVDANQQKPPGKERDNHNGLQ
jgi:hypothetical protein